MKRPTSKVFLAAHLSLPTDNPCRFHLEALPWPPLHISLITSAGAFLQTEWRRGKDPHKEGQWGESHSPKGIKVLGNLNSLFSYNYRISKGHTQLHAGKRAHTHTVERVKKR